MRKFLRLGAIFAISNFNHLIQNNMKSIKSSISAVLCAVFVVFASCNFSEDYKLSAATVVTLSQESESAVFSVSHKGGWGVQAEGLEQYIGANVASVGGFSIIPSSGFGNTEVEVSLLNELTENSEVELKIVDVSSKAVISVVKLKAVLSND